MNYYKQQLLLIPFLLSFLSIMVGQEKDWADLNRYKKENEQLSASNVKYNRIVFMGNSITEAWKILRPDFFLNNGFVNRGISGQTTPQMLLRFRPDVIELQPELVVILAGTNDIAQNTGYIPIKRIAANIMSMAELARFHKIKVIICSVLPAVDFPWNPGMEPARKIVKLNTILKNYAIENTISYVDYYSSLVDGNGGLKVPEYTTANDFVHPNEKAYKVMEKILLDAIDKNL